MQSGPRRAEAGCGASGGGVQGGPRRTDAGCGFDVGRLTKNKGGCLDRQGAGDGPH